MRAYAAYYFTILLFRETSFHEIGIAKSIGYTFLFILIFIEILRYKRHQQRIQNMTNTRNKFACITELLFCIGFVCCYIFKCIQFI